MPTTPCVLAVVREASEFASLAASLSGLSIKVTSATDLLDAILQQLCSPAEVVICDADYVDWQTALAVFNPVKGRPALVFLSHGADERLWADMLQAGAHDLLATPCRPDELRRVVCSAL